MRFRLLYSCILLFLSPCIFASFLRATFDTGPCNRPFDQNRYYASRCKPLRPAMKLTAQPRQKNQSVNVWFLGNPRVTIIPKYNMSNFDQDILKIYTNPTIHRIKFLKKLTLESQYFLNKPYQLGVLGEGPSGLFDQSPLYRTDIFDCTTFVSTILALVESDNLAEFKQNIIKIRYKDAKISFTSRNHFISLDWNVNNEHNGYLKDINTTILDQQGQPIAVNITTLINKPAWYQHLPSTTIKLFKEISPHDIHTRLKKLHQLFLQVTPEMSQMTYLPMSKLFVNHMCDPQIFDQIPSGVVIEIVRQKKYLKKLIGTNLDISHMGLGIRIQHQLIFREASATDKKIKDMPLKKYLMQFLNDSTVKGIRIEKILQQSTSHSTREKQ